MNRPGGWSSNPEGDNPDHWVRVDPPYTNKWVEVRSSYYGGYLEPDQLDAMAAELTKSAAWIRQHQAESGQQEKLMSGGSFNYLYRKTAIELLEKENFEYLANMYSALLELGYAGLAAERTASIMNRLARIEKDLENLLSDHALAEVWRAVEWWKSNDFSETDVKAALFDYDREQ